MAAKPRNKATTIDEYLAAVSADKRAALEKLRKTIRLAAPEAEECISYGLAAFRLHGKPLVAFGAAANHCAFFLMDSTTVADFRDELKDYETSKGTIRFQPDKPLPAALVRKLVKARIAENTGREPHAAPRRRPRPAPNPTLHHLPDPNPHPSPALGPLVKKRRMAARKSAAGPARKRVARPEPASSQAGASQTDPAVIAFLRKLDHPRKPELEAIRQLILGVSPQVREGIKWNSPSFRTTDWFATINVHGKDRLRLILHTGAKVKASAKKGLKIADPAGMLKWLAKDRCLVTLGDENDIQDNRVALRAIVREWIRQL